MKTLVTILLVAHLVPVVGAAPALASATPGSEWAVAVFPGGEEFVLEVAADPERRRVGYMYREHVGQREGMIFLFDDVGHHSIWMKNCRTSLDIIWLDAQMTVVDFALDRQPCPADGPCPSVAPLRAASYVLEVAAGTVRELGLRPGQQIQVLAEPPIR